LDLSNRYVKTNTKADFESYISEKKVQKRGGYFMALSFFVPGQAKMRGALNAIADFLDRLLSTEKRNTTAGFYVFAKK
jgi:hypothetical protein